MKKLLLLLLLAIPLAHPARSQQFTLECVVSTSTACPDSGPNPGNGTQGTPLWQAAGQINFMFHQVYNAWGPASSFLATGILTYSDELTPWSGPKDGGHCPGGGGVMVVCGLGVIGTVTLGHCAVFADSAHVQDGGGSGCGGSGGTPGGMNGQIQVNLSGSFGGVSTTGTGNVVLAVGPVITLPNATGLPVSTGLSGLAAGMANFLGAATSANLDSALSDATGTGRAVFNNSPVLTTPGIAGSGTGVTSLASANTSGTNYTATLPAANDTVVEQSQPQTLTSKSIDASEVNTGTMACARQPAFTGDVTSTSGTCNTSLGAAAAAVAAIKAQTAFTVSGTGCTPTVTSAGPFAGVIALATGPCTALTITINGATGFTAPHGFICSAADRTAQAAGTYIPKWGESSTTTTTVTIPVPAAAATTDSLSVSCDFE